MTDVPDRPLNLRPSTHPRAARWLTRLLGVGCVLVLLGLPVWIFMHGSASGWEEGREVTATVAGDARCRSGPPPGEPRTCAARWPGGRGEASNRYGGPAPEQGGVATGRLVDDDLVLTGYARVLLAWALVAPSLTLVGLAVGLGSGAVLVRLDPRWWGRRTDLL